MNINEQLEINFVMILNAARSNNIDELKRLIIKRDVIFLKQKEGDQK